MKRSIFEMIGPVMVGPSSSHTAGMARIGAEAARLLPAGAVKIRLTMSHRLSKTYTGHRSDTAAIGGALGLGPDSPDLKNAYALAAERGIQTCVDFFEEGEVPQNTLRVEFTYPDGSVRSLTGVSVGGGSIELLALDQQKCEIRPKLEYGETLPEAKGIFSLKELENSGKSYAELALDYEAQRSGHSRKEIRGRMKEFLGIMKESVKNGLEENHLLYGLTSGADGKKLLEAEKKGCCPGIPDVPGCGGQTSLPGGGVQARAAAYAISVMEQNASMGRLVAAPTGGSAGIVPGVLLAVAEKFRIDDEKLVDGLLTAALYGVILDERGISFSGSVGGCQGEIGVSAAMAAAAECSLFTEDKGIIDQAFALTLKNLLGLVCDPIAGPIEVPCIKRNAMGVAAAMMMCDLALAGIRSYIPADEVMDALKDVEERMPAELKCAAIGGLACTKTACAFRKSIGQ